MGTAPKKRRLGEIYQNHKRTDDLTQQLRFWKFILNRCKVVQTKGHSLPRV